MMFQCLDEKIMCHMPSKISLNLATSLFCDATLSETIAKRLHQELSLHRSKDNGTVKLLFKTVVYGLVPDHFLKIKISLIVKELLDIIHLIYWTDVGCNLIKRFSYFNGVSRILNKLNNFFRPGKHIAFLILVLNFYILTPRHSGLNETGTNRAICCSVSTMTIL